VYYTHYSAGVNKYTHDFSTKGQIFRKSANNKRTNTDPLTPFLGLAGLKLIAFWLFIFISDGPRADYPGSFQHQIHAERARRSRWKNFSMYQRSVKSKPPFFNPPAG